VPTDDRAARYSSDEAHPYPLEFDLQYFMERKMFWAIWTVLGLLADVALPFWWGMAATIPLGVLSWWIAYRSGWF
jgi:hypothetical protein